MDKNLSKLNLELEYRLHSSKKTVLDCCILGPAGNKEPRGHSLTHPHLPPVAWGGESEEKGKNLWAGRTV